MAPSGRLAFLNLECGGTLPPLRAPFATWDEPLVDCHDRSLTTNDIPGAQAACTIKGPVRQEFVDKWNPRKWTEDAERGGRPAAFTTTKRHVNPGDPVYELPGGPNTIPAGAMGEVFSNRVTDGLDVRDIAGAKAEPLYARPVRGTYIDYGDVEGSKPMRLTRSVDRWPGVGSNLDTEDIEMGRKQWGFHRKVPTNPLDPHYVHDVNLMLLEEASQAEWAERLQKLKKSNVNMVDQVMEKLYPRREQLSQTCARLDKEDTHCLPYAEFKQSLHHFGLDLSTEDFSQLTSIVDKEHTGHVNYREFETALRFPDGLERPEPKAISVDKRGGRASSTSLGQGAQVVAEQAPHKGKRAEKAQKEWQLFDTVTGKLKIERYLSVEEKKDMQIRQKIVERADMKLGNLRAAFRRFDDNRDGVVSYAEFKEGLNELGVKLKPGEFERLTRAFDEDGNGYVDLQEFKENLEKQTALLMDASFYTNNLKNLQKLEATIREEIGKGTLSLYPKRHAGTLAPENKLTSPQENKEGHYLGEQLRRKLVLAIDQHLGGSAQTAFRTFDGNKDHALTLQEFRAALKKFKVELTEEEAKNLMSVVDKDESGSLQYDELAKALQPTDDPAYIRRERKLNSLLGRIAEEDPELHKQLQEKLTDRNGFHSFKDKVLRPTAAKQTEHISLEDFTQALLDLGIYLPKKHVSKLFNKLTPREEDPNRFNPDHFLNVVRDVYKLPDIPKGPPTPRSPVKGMPGSPSKIPLSPSKAGRAVHSDLSSPRRSWNGSVPQTPLSPSKGSSLSLLPSSPVLNSGSLSMPTSPVKPLGGLSRVGSKLATPFLEGRLPSRGALASSYTTRKQDEERVAEINTIRAL